MIETTPETVLDFWFGKLTGPEHFPEDKAALWFQGGPDFDAAIQQQFGATLESAIQGRLDQWAEMPKSLLALIVVLDQFSRNVYRGTPQAFAQDARALELALDAIHVGQDQQLYPVQRCFLYLPLEHSEDLFVQNRCVALFEALAEEVPAAIEFPMRNALDYAYQHQRIIQRFGRFPHRNSILGRESTAEEVAFLEEPNSSF